MTSKKQIQQIIGGLAGAFVGFYCGIMVIFPLIGGTIAGGLVKRFAPVSLQPFNGALSVVCGQGFWMLWAGLLLTFENTSLLQGFLPVSVDLVIIIAGVLWLLYRPGLGPVIFLSIYEFLVLIENIVVICGADLGSIQHKSLTLHIVLRVAALILLVTGYLGFRKAAAEKLPTAAPSQNQGSGSVYVLMPDGKHSIYEESQVHTLLAQKALQPEMYFWKEGMTDWKPLSELTPSR